MSRIPLHKNRSSDEDLDGLMEQESNEWQTTYMDTVTILLAFFVILSSSPAVDIGLLLGRENPGAERLEESENEYILFYPIEALNRKLQELMAEEINSGVLTLDKQNYEIRMLFSGSSFFKLGEAELLPGGKEIIARIVGHISTMDSSDFKLDVEGHTDSAPISTLRFADNWMLSAARASNVVRYFLEAGIPAEKLKASGYADTFLLVPDRDENGNYLPEQQDKNRRIVVRLYYE